ncbi:MAG: HAMP domain-containing sensor histidine kinase [Bacteroidota bacterium]
MTNSTIRRVVILGAVAIIGIIAVQSYWVMRNWDLKEQEFQQTVHIALLQVAKDLANYDSIPLPSQNLVNRKASNYYIVNINNVIDAGVLEYYLFKEFADHALEIDFEYAIYDCSSDDMVYGNYCTMGDIQRENVVLGELPKYDEFTYYFGVKFPNRNSYLLGEMPRTIVFTVILFIAILFFIYSMSVILRQKRLSELQKDFINNMTHEFKTPISTIKISADVFLNNERIQEDARLMRYAAIIKEQNQRLNHQVEKVLQLAKIERDSFKLKLEEVDLHQLLVQAIRSNELQVAEFEGGRLRYDLRASEPLIRADALHLTNILHNLMDNAIKYCKKSPDIIIRTQDEQGGILLQIEDQGIGIAKEQQAKVFTKFYRVSTGNIHNVKGFGLGLFYIKSICDAHDWKIQLDSEPEQGTKISILIKRPKANFAQLMRNLFSSLKTSTNPQ